MDLRKSIPAVLLLALSVPAAQAEALGSTAAEARVAVEGVSALSAENVGLAAKYLRQRADGETPDRDASAAWDIFYPSCDAMIRRFAGKFRSRGVDIDDCAQEVWTDLARNLPGFTVDQSRGRFTSWLFTIVRSKATDILRRQIRRPAVSLSPIVAADLSIDDADPALALERESDRQMIRRAMSMLKERVSETSYRVLHLRHVDGMSVSETADALGINSEQVWMREHRMKRKLRDLMPFVEKAGDVA